MEERIPDATEKVQHPCPSGSLLSYLGHVEKLRLISSIVIMAFSLPEGNVAIHIFPGLGYMSPLSHRTSVLVIWEAAA
ncbi:uncharacterized protein G2W53_041029 [Senna tora]|uniref:Uncharacterized protein n=1 Tax=Senna tora TaxID=362788 RepID=A0A834VXN5_9FABA|nr:uncharacterized protein G2W53_041029 [Senna tora]